LSCALLALAPAGQAGAKPAQTTKYVYYTVTGDSAVEIYDAMISRGPRVNGAKAYAATSAITTQDGKLLQASSCQVRDYRLKLDFVIRLPRVSNEAVLSGAERRRWQQFSTFLKAHEEHHRAIWLGCAADLERQVRAIRVKSCADADRQASRLWDKMRAACNRKHEAFDAAEQRKVMRHPFVQLVNRRAMQTHAAAAR
jgi:predicted secreted Zn-dependent protease